MVFVETFKATNFVQNQLSLNKVLLVSTLISVKSFAVSPADLAVKGGINRVCTSYFVIAKAPFLEMIGRFATNLI